MYPKYKKYVINTNSSKNTGKIGHTYLQWALSLLSSSVFLVYGFQIGWVSPMKKVLQSDASPTGFSLTDVEVAVIAGIPPLAAIIGVPMCGYIAEVYGRKIAVLTMMLLHMTSWTLKLTSMHTAVILAARFCGGVPLGGSFIVVPMYVREISQDSLRGILVSLTISFQHIGVLTMYAMGSYLDYYTVLWIALSISSMSLFLMLLAPESTAFLVKTGKFDLATKSLAKLRGLNEDDVIVTKEIVILKNEDSHYKTEEKLTFGAIFQNKAWRRGYFLSQILLCCTAFHGCFAIVTYALSIMTQAGISIDPELLSFIVPVVLMCGSIVPLIGVEKIGRKPLLVGAYVVSAVSLASLASALLAQAYGAVVPGWVPGVTIAVALFAFSAGVLPVPSVIMNDMFKFQVRGKLLGVIIMVSWGCISLQVILFDLLSTTLGLYTVFYVAAAVNVLGALVVIMFVPETKGRTTDQIEAILAGGKSDRTIEANS